MLGDGGGGAVFGSFAAAVAAASMMTDTGHHRRNVQCFYRDPSIVHAHNSLMDIVAVDCSFAQMISGHLAMAVDYATADGSLVAK